MTTAIIAQARMGSSRLPGKVLKELGGRPVLEHVLTRASRAPGADIVCVATTVEPADDAIATAAKSLGFPVFRGSETDVLGRYAGAAEMVKADVIVRITCDCPLIDPGVVGEAIRKLKERNADYVAQEWSEWPQGIGCEVFPRALLNRAAAEASDTYDREHVTPWIRNKAAQIKYLMKGPGGPVSEQRWLLDYPEDYAFLDRLFAKFPGNTPPDSWETVWRELQKHPEIYALNKHLREDLRPR
jgi:spore coat polysaccharide biosynthesis protein SpsF (cytidylyltransferase family)